MESKDQRDNQISENELKQSIVARLPSNYEDRERSKSRNIKPLLLKIGDQINNHACFGYVVTSPRLLKNGDVAFQLATHWKKGHRGVEVRCFKERELELLKRPKGPLPKKT